MITLSFNGEPLATQAATLHDLLVERGFDLKAAFACAVDTLFVPRAQWPQQALRDGQRVDVIAPITGG